MKRFFRNFRFAMLGVSILCIALGMAVLLWPDQAMKLLCYGFGGVLVVSGILQIISYITGERSGLLQKLLMISGIISIVLGAWIILMSPSQVRTLTMIVLGIVLLYHGVMDIKYGFDIKAAQGKSWGMVMFFGIATCAVGVLMLVNPFQDDAVRFMVAGIGFLFDGLTDFVTVFSVATAKARYEKLASAAPVIELEPGAAEVVSVPGNSAETPGLAPQADTEPEDSAPAAEAETEAPAADQQE